MTETPDPARDRELARREDRPVGTAGDGRDVFVIFSVEVGHVVAVCTTREAAEQAAADLSFATSIRREPLWS